MPQLRLYLKTPAGFGLLQRTLDCIADAQGIARFALFARVRLTTASGQRESFQTKPIVHSIWKE